MTWCRSAIPDRFSKIGRSRNRITWDAGGGVGIDFKAAFGCPAQVVNDAAMQALRSYKGGKMLFLGLGTGLGSSMIVDGTIEPMELGHLPYNGTTYEDHVGIQGLKRLGKKKWRKRVADVVSGLVAAFEPDDIVLGGGNVRKLKELPPGCRAGNNANAFRGGFALWNRDDERHSTRAERTAASFDAGQGSDDRPRIS
jgi:polyphosphate glucokinase